MPTPPVPTMGARLATYLTARDAQRHAAADRALGAMSERERRLVREAAVMGYVQGTRAPAGAAVPPDTQIVATVISACQHMPDLYPVTASLGQHISPLTDVEELTGRVLDLHQPTCQHHTGVGKCGCPTPPRCATCDLDSVQSWPCPTLAAFGRIAACTNTIEHTDGTAEPCRGYLNFTPGAVQARCLACGAWCGAQVATYVP